MLCSIKITLVFGDKKMAKQFKTVPLSYKTVARAVIKIKQHVSAKVKGIVQQCKDYLLVLDKSNDVCDVNQLLIFILTIDESFTINDKLLQAVSLHDSTAKGLDIYNSLGI